MFHNAKLSRWDRENNSSEAWLYQPGTRYNRGKMKKMMVYQIWRMSLKVDLEGSIRNKYITEYVFRNAR
jgi:hypothetical protein